MPQPEKKGNLDLCAREVHEQLEYLNFVWGPEIKDEEARDRLCTACSGYAKIREKIQAIEALAQKTNNRELIALLNEEFGYGLLKGW